MNCHLSRALAYL